MRCAVGSMSLVNVRQLTRAGVVAWCLGMGLIGASGCIYTAGTDCGQGCCNSDADCSGGKACHYGECQCLAAGMADCDTGACVPLPCPTCTDGVQNGAE